MSIMLLDLKPEMLTNTERQSRHVPHIPSTRIVLIVMAISRILSNSPASYKT